MDAIGPWSNARYVHDRNARKKLIPSLQQKFRRRSTDCHHRINLAPAYFSARIITCVTAATSGQRFHEIKDFVRTANGWCANV